ncbi:DUF7281 domain-containing protein [Shewanella youngdeokensis]|uniref:DUF7281 domain-containing protein n=1 Tax=Shewanella youngdeokensis TaxID=2999068 RepID=A0ABZ0K1P7_9GAMM|nr:hypothetical protein RGE70_02210 [Shewanella sp. DAU334]
MARLTKVHVRLIAEALKKRTAKVRYSANWQKIHAELEVGSVDESERYLMFNAAQLQQLDQMASHYFGSSLLSAQFDGERSEVAKHSRYEKLATIKPDEQYVLLKPQPLFTGINTDCALRAPVELIIHQLKSHSIRHVVIVENLDAFDRWQQFAVAVDLTQALVVYRGHDALAKGVKALLQQLPATISVVACVDIDPSGLKIALTLPSCSQILAPSIDAISTIMATSNSSEDFDQQHSATKFIAQHESDWPTLQRFVIAHRISIKQQHLLAFQLPLMLHVK